MTENIGGFHVMLLHWVKEIFVMVELVGNGLDSVSPILFNFGGDGMDVNLLGGVGGR